MKQPGASKGYASERLEPNTLVCFNASFLKQKKLEKGSQMTQLEAKTVGQYGARQEPLKSSVKSEVGEGRRDRGQRRRRRRSGRHSKRGEQLVNKASKTMDRLQLAALLVIALVCLQLTNHVLQVEAKTHHSKRQVSTSQQQQQQQQATATTTGRENTNWWNLWWQQYINEAVQPTVRPIVAVSFNGRTINLSDQQAADSEATALSSLASGGDVDTNFVLNNLDQTQPELNPIELERNEKLRLVASSLPNNMHPFAAKQMMLAQHKSDIQQANWQSVRPTMIAQPALSMRDARANRQAAAYQVDSAPEQSLDEASNLGIQMRNTMNGRQQQKPRQQQQQQQQQQLLPQQPPDDGRFEQQQQQNQMVDYTDGEPDLENNLNIINNSNMDGATIDNGPQRNSGSTNDSSSSGMMQQQFNTDQGPAKMPKLGGNSQVGQRTTPAGAGAGSGQEPRQRFGASGNGGELSSVEVDMSQQIGVDGGSQRQPKQPQRASTGIVQQQQQQMQPNRATTAGAIQSTRAGSMPTSKSVPMSAQQRPTITTTTSSPLENSFDSAIGDRQGPTTGTGTTGSSPSVGSTKSPPILMPSTSTIVDTNETPISFSGDEQTSTVSREQSQPKTSTFTTPSSGRVELENGRPATGVRFQQGTTTSARLPTPSVLKSSQAASTSTQAPQRTSQQTTTQTSIENTSGGVSSARDELMSQTKPTLSGEQAESGGGSTVFPSLSSQQTSTGKPLTSSPNEQTSRPPMGSVSDETGASGNNVVGSNSNSSPGSTVGTPGESRNATSSVTMTTMTMTTTPTAATTTTTTPTAITTTITSSDDDDSEDTEDSDNSDSGMSGGGNLNNSAAETEETSDDDSNESDSTGELSTEQESTMTTSSPMPSSSSDSNSGSSSSSGSSFQMMMTQRLKVNEALVSTTTQQPSLTTIDIERLPKTTATPGAGGQRVVMMVTEPRLPAKSQAETPSGNQVKQQQQQQTTLDDVPRIRPSPPGLQQQQQSTQQQNSNQPSFVMMTLDQGRATAAIDGETAITVPMDTLMRMMMMNQITTNDEQIVNPDKQTKVPSTTTTTQRPPTTEIRSEMEQTRTTSTSSVISETSDSRMSKAEGSPASNLPQMSTTSTVIPITSMMTKQQSTGGPTASTAPATAQAQPTSGVTTTTTTTTTKKKLQPPPTTKMPGKQGDESGAGGGSVTIAMEAVTTATPPSRNSISDKSKSVMGKAEQTNWATAGTVMQKQAAGETSGIGAGGGREPKVELINMDLVPIQRMMMMKQQQQQQQMQMQMQVQVQPMRAQTMRAGENRITDNMITRKQPDQQQKQQPINFGSNMLDTGTTRAQQQQVTMLEVEPGMRLRPVTGTLSTKQQQQQQQQPVTTSRQPMSSTNQGASTVYMMMMNGDLPAHSKRPGPVMMQMGMQQQQQQPSQRLNQESMMVRQQQQMTTSFPTKTTQFVQPQQTTFTTPAAMGPKMRTSSQQQATTMRQQSQTQTVANTISGQTRTSSSGQQQTTPASFIPSTTLIGSTTSSSRSSSGLGAVTESVIVDVTEQEKRKTVPKDSAPTSTLRVTDREQQQPGAEKSRQPTEAAGEQFASTKSATNTEATSSSISSQQQSIMTTSAPLERIPTSTSTSTSSSSSSSSLSSQSSQTVATSTASSTPISTTTQTTTTTTTTTSATRAPFSMTMQQLRQQQQQPQEQRSEDGKSDVASVVQPSGDGKQEANNSTGQNGSNLVQSGRLQLPQQQQQRHDDLRPHQATTKTGAPGKIGKPANLTSSFIPSKLRNDFNKLARVQQQSQATDRLARVQVPDTSTGAGAGTSANAAISVAQQVTTTQSPAAAVQSIRQFGGANRMSVIANQPVPFGRPAAMTVQSMLATQQQAAAGNQAQRFELLPSFEYGPSIAVRRPDEPLANGQVPNCTLTGKNFCVLTKDYPMNEVRQAVERSFRSVRIMYEELQTVSDQELHREDYINATNNQAATGKFACQTQVEMMRPGWAKDEITKEWMLVVNTDVFPQRVRTESCAQPNTPCEFIAPFYDSTCQQRYSLHRMIAIDPHDPSRSPQVAVFKFPAGCVCRVHPIRKTTTSMILTSAQSASPTTPIPTTIISSSTSKSIRRRRR